MNLFDFIVQNTSILENLYADSEGNVEIPPDEFDFNHPDMKVVVDDNKLVFQVSVGTLTPRCVVDVDNIKDVAQYMQKITDLDTREKVIEMIEETYRSEAEADRNKAEERFNEARKKFDDATKDFDMIVDALGGLKKAWQIP